MPNRRWQAELYAKTIPSVATSTERLAKKSQIFLQISKYNNLFSVRIYITSYHTGRARIKMFNIFFHQILLLFLTLEGFFGKFPTMHCGNLTKRSVTCDLRPHYDTSKGFQFQFTKPTITYRTYITSCILGFKLILYKEPIKDSVIRNKK